MIFFLTTAAHAYTIRSLSQDFGAPLPPCRAVTYDELFNAAHCPAATYIFTDLERLSHDESVVAASYYRALRDQAGFRVLNDPSRSKLRYGLLRSLHEAGFNDFDCYRADGHPKPSRFPVFVRSEAAHDPTLTRLLQNQLDLDRALLALENAGIPLRGLIVIEYCAEPVSPGVFRRWGSFAIGDRVHLDHVVQEDNWNVKWGTSGLTSDYEFLQFKEDIKNNRFSDDLQAIFKICAIDYGRADFSVVSGRLQIYEINTNPMIGRLTQHRSTIWMEAMRFAHGRFAEYLQSIDTASTGRVVRLDRDSFMLQAKRALLERKNQRLHLANLMKPGGRQ